MLNMPIYIMHMHVNLYNYLICCHSMYLICGHSKAAKSPEDGPPDLISSEPVL